MRAARNSATKLRKPRTAPKEERRKQLIEAAIKSIARHGISGTTMTTVTKIAGLSIGSVNFHFSTKESLLDETLRHLAEEHRGRWRQSYDQADLTPQAKLLAIVDAHYSPITFSRDKLAVWFAFYGEAANRAKYYSLLTGIDPERWTVSNDLLQQIIDDGKYSNIQARDVAATLEGLYDGFGLNLLMYPAEFKRADARRRIRLYLATTFPLHFERPVGD